MHGILGVSQPGRGWAWPAPEVLPRIEAEIMQSHSRPHHSYGFTLLRSRPCRHVELLINDAMSPLFLAVIEATEEAIYNSMFRATTMSGNGHTVEALPIDKTIEILREHRSLK